MQIHSLPFWIHDFIFIIFSIFSSKFTKLSTTANFWATEKNKITDFTAPHNDFSTRFFIQVNLNSKNKGMFWKKTNMNEKYD